MFFAVWCVSVFVGAYKSVPVPLIVIVPTFVPLVRERETETESALAVIPSSFDLSAALIKPASLVVAALYVVSVFVGAYKSVPVPLIVIVPTLVPLVREREKETESAPDVMPSSFDLSLALIKPAALVVAAL